MTTNWTRILIGAISGIVATGPMTAAMIFLHRRLPHTERYPLPPREITMKLARKAGIDHKMSTEARSAATMLSHFAYGAAGGMVFAGVTDPKRSPWSKGLIFGLLVWTASYLGWLPAAGVLEPATEHPQRRNLLMIAAHLIWGTVLSGFASLLTTETEHAGITPQPFSTPHIPLRDIAVSRR